MRLWRGDRSRKGTMDNPFGSCGRGGGGNGLWQIWNNTSCGLKRWRLVRMNSSSKRWCRGRSRERSFLNTKRYRRNRDMALFFLVLILLSFLRGSNRIGCGLSSSRRFSKSNSAGWTGWWCGEICRCSRGRHHSFHGLNWEWRRCDAQR